MTYSVIPTWTEINETLVISEGVMRNYTKTHRIQDVHSFPTSLPVDGAS